MFLDILIIDRTSVITKLVHRFMVISGNILEGYLIITDKQILKFIWRYKISKEGLLIFYHKLRTFYHKNVRKQTYYI